MTTDYYNEKGRQFAKSTVSLNVDALHKPFLDLLPPGSHILDAGCGSGRDVKAFSDLGYQVTAFDASQEMVAIATEYSGQQIKLMRFQEMDFNEDFDGIWACASLLHVPRSEMSDVLSRLARALRPSGILYISFKYGIGEQTKNGRFFNNYNEQYLERELAKQSALKLLRIWTTPDVRPDRSNETWLNALVSKQS